MEGRVGGRVVVVVGGSVTVTMREVVRVEMVDGLVLLLEGLDEEIDLVVLEDTATPGRHCE